MKASGLRIIMRFGVVNGNPDWAWYVFGSEIKVL